MQTFGRRTYGFEKFVGEVRGIAGDFRTAVAAFTAGDISPAFRERIMLAVTGENDCRYCAFAHSNLGRAAGLSQLQADMILAGDFEQVPEDERPAVEFARRWAESDGEPGSDACQKLVDSYGAQKAAQVEMFCRLIRVGNLSGNTLDSMLFSLSKGKIGG
ncbi:MAG: carboxymuconolactone decarboxylase family protein [Myxococcota bacterium]|jgi:AhpD family alkylhydroperoxidase